MSDDTDTASGAGDDPRSVTDDQLREEHSREEVEYWRRKADEHHSNWFSVMNNPYGRD